MKIQVRHAEFSEIQSLRELFRREANCQIVTDSILPRGLADPYLILLEGQICGYAGVWNVHFPGRLMEFFVVPEHRFLTAELFQEVLKVSKATHFEAQTNMPNMLTLLFDFARNIHDEKVLFGDGFTSVLECPKGVFRRRRQEDHVAVGAQPVGEFVIESAGQIVASGGNLTHYNPPYADLFMQVHGDHVRKGFGSYLVQELKRVCYEVGLIPAARCDTDNVASRRTLEKAGMFPVGRLLAGKCK